MTRLKSWIYATYREINQRYGFPIHISGTLHILFNYLAGAIGEWIDLVPNDFL